VKYVDLVDLHHSEMSVLSMLTWLIFVMVNVYIKYVDLFNVRHGEMCILSMLTWLILVMMKCS
jgi:hypothetical protein